MIKKTLLSLYFSFPLLFITLLIHFDFTSKIDKAIFNSTFSALLLGALFFSSFLISFLFLLLINKNWILFLSLGFSLMTVCCILLAIFLHRDFFTYNFQLVGCYYILLVLKVKNNLSNMVDRQIFNYLWIASLVLFILIFEWLILMGYSICIRTEPRWLESLLYNIYNLAFAILILVIGITLRNEQFVLLIVKTDKLYLNQKEISFFLNQTEIRMLSFFLKNRSKGINCYNFSNELNLTKKFSLDCHSCLKQNYSVMSCKSYKYLYNRIHQIKRFLSNFNLGRITRPEKRNNIKEEGWSLRLFDNIRVKQ